MKTIKAFRIFLLVLIIIGLILIFTEKNWVPGLVDKILSNESAVSTPAPTEITLKHFTDSNGTFTFDYNSLFLATGEVGSNVAWRQNTIENGALLASVSIPKSFILGPLKTNFSDARFTVGKSNDPNAVKSCLVASNGETNETPATISGHAFNKFTLSDAGAGNFYETTSYRGIVGGNCYAIEYTIHSTNIANYPPELGIKEFNKSEIQNELENIVTSFKFL